MFKHFIFSILKSFLAQPRMAASRTLIFSLQGLCGLNIKVPARTLIFKNFNISILKSFLAQARMAANRTLMFNLQGGTLMLKSRPAD